MTRILLTGQNGQIGWELQRTLASLGEVIALDRRGMDLANPDSIRRGIREHKPDLIVNAAAYTAVDKAEEEPDLAMAINGIAPGIVAEEAKQLGALVVHYSTDYVFSGKNKIPYIEEDSPDPINVYGRTKLDGERAIQTVGALHLILRTSWVYGARGNNFLTTILRLAKEQDKISVVDDQIGVPTWCRMIARSTYRILERLVNSSERNQFAPGIYHLVATGQASWFEYAGAILKRISKVPGYRVKTLLPITSAEYPTAATRPSNSVLSNNKASEQFNLDFPSWNYFLDECMNDMGYSVEPKIGMRLK